MLVASCVFRSSPPRLSPSCTCSLSTPPRPSATSPAIVIPPRVERGPTAVLEALAATVGRDDTAPHYKVRGEGQVHDPEISQSADKKSADILANPQIF